MRAQLGLPLQIAPGLWVPGKKPSCNIPTNTTVATNAPTTDLVAFPFGVKIHIHTHTHARTHARTHAHDNRNGCLSVWRQCKCTRQPVLQFGGNINIIHDNRPGRLSVCSNINIHDNRPGRLSVCSNINIHDNRPGRLSVWRQY